MSAYLIAELEITDPAGFEEYRQQVPATIARHGGRYIVRGGGAETLEGNWSPNRVVVLEFPDRETAKRWWSSTEYAAAKALRQRCAHTEMIVIDGV